MMMRVMLYEAAQSMLRSKKWSWLKAWAMQIARRRGVKKAIVALVSIGRDRLERQNITLRGRDDAGDALRSGPEHVVPFEEMVVAQGLGDADRQAPRDKKGDRGAGASAGRNHAPHLDQRHRVPLDSGTSRGSNMKIVQVQIR